MNMTKLIINKYCIMKNDLVLTHKGFKNINKLNYSVIKLFNSIYSAKEWLIYSTLPVVDVEFKKIKVIYEVEEC